MGAVSLSSGILEEFKGLGLAKHNEKRRLHDSGDMAVDDVLSQDAQAYAQSLAENITGMSGMAGFVHDPNRGPVGENIAFSCGFHPSVDDGVRAGAADSVENWYGEISAYNFADPESNGSGTGHFTQVVWKNSKILGMGIGVRDNFEYMYNGTLYILQAYFVVARYAPPGNMAGHYGANVPNLV